MSEIDPRLATVLADDAGILETFGMTVRRALDGVCELDCVVPEVLMNAGGYAHGAIAFALLDTAAAYAVRSLGTRGVTTSANLHYLRGAVAGDHLSCRVDCVNRTRRTASLRGEVWLRPQETDPAIAAHGMLAFQLFAE